MLGNGLCAVGRYVSHGHSMFPCRLCIYDIVAGCGHSDVFQSGQRFYRRSVKWHFVRDRDLLVLHQGDKFIRACEIPFLEVCQCPEAVV